ncbi:hypothetical protein NBT05_13920 [Aquimarina sp. ERC-38]|uniref:hypothetical protein n=1 Tax=Aquimarina sp. ERC-38 TaxID=2949996 RepID=UPI002246FBDF|nr:hypothetical protein [Aquimarina sp. ERC-38]UZO80040.1 hypothetical protein NBT05_13920 [Aquimarina sp. ERC-38]
MKSIAILILLLTLTVFYSCKETQKQPEKEGTEVIEPKISTDAVDNLKDSKIDTTEKTTITQNGFYGFKIGDKINLKSKNLQESVRKNGEGSFLGFDLMDDKGEKIGFILSEPDNQEIIKVIEISSSKYKTNKGIGIGSTYQELKNQYPDIETHGSEIESRTTSKVGNLYFQLDTAFNTYEIDESKIKPSTLITSIFLL